MTRRSILIISCCVALSGCASNAYFDHPGISSSTRVGVPADITPGELPPPDAPLSGQAARPYVIGPYDKLTVGVFGFEELAEREVQADGAGRFSFPLAGEIDARGRTPAEVEGTLRARLRDRFIRDPQVTVNLKETMSQNVTVFGDVVEPGVYPMSSPMTLMRAIARAQGATEFAKLDDVVIVRTVGKQQIAGLYNIQAISRGNYADPEVYANDLIIVGDSRERRLFKDALQLLPAITTPLVYILTN